MTRLITRLAAALLVPLVLIVPAGARAPAAFQPQTHKGSSLDDLVKLVPDEAALVVVFPDFAKAIAGVAAFGTAAGIEDLAELEAEELLDELDIAALTDELRKHLRADGPLVLAVTEPGEEPLLLATLKTPPAGAPGALVELKGDVLLAAPGTVALQAARSASGKFAHRFAQQVRDVLAGHDLAAYVNVPGWSLEIEQALETGEMLTQVGMQAGAPTTQAAEANAALISAIFGMMRSVAAETDAVAIALGFDRGGAHLSQRVHFKPDGRAAAYLKSVRKSEKELLRGLRGPAGSMIVAAEWTLPPEVETLSGRFLRAIVATHPALKEDESFKTKMRSLTEFYRKLDGYSMVGDVGPPAPLLRFSGLYLTTEAQWATEHLWELWELSSCFTTTLAPGFSMSVSQEAGQIGDVKVHVGHLQFKTEDAESQRLLDAIYGNLAVCVAPHPAGVALGTGSPEVARERLEKLLTGKGPLLSDDARVIAARKQLSPRPQGLALIDPLGFMKGMLEATEVLSDELGPMPLPEIEWPQKPGPYVAFGLYLYPTACGVEAYLPAEVVKNMADVFLRLEKAAVPTEPY